MRLHKQDGKVGLLQGNKGRTMENFNDFEYIMNDMTAYYLLNVLVQTSYPLNIYIYNKKRPNITNSVMHSHNKHACTVWTLSNPSAILVKMSDKKVTVNISGSHHSKKYKLLRLCVCQFGTIFQKVDWTTLGKVSITRQTAVTISVCIFNVISLVVHELQFSKTF